jgi:hypothetical protein
MARPLDHEETLALLKHYDIDVHEGHRQAGMEIVVAGESKRDSEPAITVTVGAHTARRICPVTEFLAEGLVAELKEPHLKAASQAGRTIAHLIVKASRMQVESELVSFTLTALLEGDHYEVAPKSIAIEGSHTTKIPHRLEPHAHDRTVPHSPQRQH